MVNNIGKGLSVALISMLFISCGGGGGSSSTSPFSTFSGTVSDGPIENAKVCITDVELDSEYCPVYTDESGYYSFKYIVENGKEYLITAYGSDGAEYTTVDYTDNIDQNGDAIPLDFMMYKVLKISGNIASEKNIGSAYKVDINPLTFRNSISNYQTDLTPDKIKQFLNETSNNNDSTSLFKDYILNEKSEYLTFFDDVKDEVELSNETALDNDTSTNNYKTITDTTIKTQLISGETNNNIGINDLINTYFAYKVIEDSRNNSISSYSTFEKTLAGSNTIVNFKYTLINEEYEGTLMYDGSGSLLDANYWQDYTDNDNRGGNELSGYVRITENGDISFKKGTFKIYADNYLESYITGNVTVNNGSTQFASFSSNDNIISNEDVEITVKSLPIEKIISSDLSGLWSGTYSTLSGSCDGGNIDLTFSDSMTNSWQANDNVNFYGTELILNDNTNIITLKDGENDWSNDAELSLDKTQITGTWTNEVKSCEGSFAVTKQ